MPLSETGTAVDIVRLIQRCRLDLSTEKHLQEGVAKILAEAGMAFEREKALSTRDIPDFVVNGSIVIECKMRDKSRKLAVFKQLGRYADHPEVTAIILATDLSMGLPPEINGKPVYLASLSRGWL